jgi:hypothetical protein
MLCFFPTLNAQLILIGTATDAGAEILCTGNKAVFKMHGKVVMSGKRSGQDIHHLNIGFDNNNGLTFATAGKKKISFSIIHQKFSHLNCRSIKRMAEKKAVERLDLEDSEPTLYPCNGYIFGKIRRIPFKKGRTRATRPNKKIYSDVGGLLKIISICSGRFYFIFKDDFSGFSEGHIIKYKSKVKGLFKFWASAKRKTDRQVAILRTGMGKDYEA